MKLSHLIFQQRANKKTILINNRDFFDIFIPGAGIFSRFTILSLVLILFPTYLIQLFFLSLPSQNYRLIVPVLIWNFCISIIACLLMVVAEFSQKRFSLTRNKVTWQYYLFDWKIGHSTSNQVDFIRCISKWDNAYHRRYLEIWAGRNKYEITTDSLSLFSVTSPELDRIAKQLGDWLELTIIQD